jgi:hypothetical protein
MADDPSAVAALVLDGLFATRQGQISTRGFGDVIRAVENQLTQPKLQGIVNALLEYELTYPLHHSVLDAICEIVESRIIEENEADTLWIPKGFDLLSRTFAWRRLKSLLELALGPFDIAERYAELYAELVLTYVDVAARSDENFEYFAGELALSLETKAESRAALPAHVQGYLGRITERLRAAYDEGSRTDGRAGKIVRVKVGSGSTTAGESGCETQEGDGADRPTTGAEASDGVEPGVEGGGRDGGVGTTEQPSGAGEGTESMGERIRAFLQEFYMTGQGQSVEAKDKKYQETFDGGSKGSDVLTFIQSQGVGDPDVVKLAYVSIGGGDGSEVGYAMEHSELRHGVMIEPSDFGAAAARKLSEALKSKGKYLEVFQGDAMQRLRDCSGKLAEWKQAGSVDGVMLSMHSVLHELPTRSPRYDPHVLLARVFEPFTRRLFYCREPASPNNWPAIVRLRITNVTGESLYGIAALVNSTLGFGDTIERLADGFVQMSSALAVEVVFKVIYSVDVDRFRYEMEERLTSFNPVSFVKVLGSYIGPAENIESNSLVTETFRNLYRAAGVEARSREDDRLNLPNAFARVVGAQVG